MAVKPTVLVCLLGVLAIESWDAAAQSDLTIHFNNAGLDSLQYQGVEHLAFGDFHLNQATFQLSSGETFNGDLSATTTVDAQAGRVNRTLAWGSITVDCKAAGNRLNVNVTVTNRSDNTLE